MPYCNQCGSLVEADQPVCSQCGHVTDAASSSLGPMPGLSSSELSATGTMALAGYWWRVLGYVIDSVILGVVLSLPLRAMGVEVYASAAVVAVLTFAYGTLTLILLPGQTLGMRLARVHCVNAATRTTITRVQAIRRTAMFCVLGLIANVYHYTRYAHPTAHQRTIEGHHVFVSLVLLVPLYVNLLWPLWDKRNQTLTDKFANTVVLRSAAS